jgi:hypothetical protein
MEHSEDNLREAARSIRPHLRNLVGDRDSTALDVKLAEILQQAEQGTDVGSAVQQLLTQRDETRAWLQLFLETGTIPSTTRGFSPLPGTSHPHPGTKFVCPDGDYVWYRPFVGVPVPECPTHRKQLVKG